MSSVGFLTKAAQFVSIGRIRRYLPAYLVLLACVSLSHHVRMIWTTGGIWSPLDEMNHYDYIDQLSSGRMPHPREYISDYTERITVDHFGFTAAVRYDGTKESLGSAGRSYEAQQPPVYYLLMAGPNYVLKKLGVAPPTQIRLLRSFNLLFLTGTAFLAILVFRELSALVGLDALLGYFIAFLTMSVRYAHRYHISPDQLAPLLGAACVYLAVRLWRTRDDRYVAWSSLAAVLAFLTKYPSGLLLPFWVVNTLFYYRHCGRRRFLECLQQLWPLALPVAYLGGNAYLYGWADVLKSQATAEYFGELVEPVFNVGYVTGQLMALSLDLRPLWEPPVLLLALLLLLVAGNYVLGFHRVFIAEDRRALPLFVACQMAGLVLLTAVLLNPYVPAIHWYHFRQYEACSLFWYAALIATPCLIDLRWVRIGGTVFGTAIATWMTWLWW